MTTEPSAAAYDELSRVYDAIPDPVGFADFYLDACEKASDVLYVGCGTGRLLAAMARQGSRCVGVDPSDGMIERARLRCADVAERVELVTARVQDLDLGRRFPVVVMAGGAFEYMLDTASQLAALRRLRAHLAPGGRVLFDVAAPPHITTNPGGNYTGEYDPRLFPEGADPVPSSVRLSMDHYRQLIRSACRFDLGGDEPLEVVYVTRYASADELRLVARVAGLRATVHGDFRGGVVSRESSNYVVTLAAP